MEEKMKESTRIFMEKQLIKNGRRMARETAGDYEIPIHIVGSYDDPPIPILPEDR